MDLFGFLSLPLFGIFGTIPHLNSYYWENECPLMALKGLCESFLFDPAGLSLPVRAIYAFYEPKKNIKRLIHNGALTRVFTGKPPHGML
jgi:hypothetical protein